MTLATCPRCGAAHDVAELPELPPDTLPAPPPSSWEPVELPAWPDEAVTAVEVPHPIGGRS